VSRDLGREARRSRRHRLPGSPPVHDLLAERVLGRAMDMSAGGLKLLLAEPLVEDTLYQVRFDLDMGQGRRATIVAGLQVLDSRLDENGLLCTGARFIHLEGPHARQLVQWLRLQAEQE
jgi:c-di-GMP-binding flagellar brake protein YcgR